MNATSSLPSSPTPTFNGVSSFISSLSTELVTATTFMTSTSTQATNQPQDSTPLPGSTASSAKQNQSGLGSQLAICASVGLVCFLLFCFLRTRWPVIFAPRKSMKRRKPPKLPDSFFGWIIPLIRISKTEMLDKVGLDAVIMLDFIVMGLKIFSLCSFFGVVALIPISTTTGNFTDPLLNPVDHLSITVVSESSPYLIAYLVFTYFFTIVTWFFLQQNYNSYIYMRARYLLQLSNTLVCRSIIITGLPEELRTDQALADYFESLGIGMVVSSHVVRHVKKLGHILRQRAHALDKLEESYVKYWGNPCINPHYSPEHIYHHARNIHQEQKNTTDQQHLKLKLDEDQVSINSTREDVVDDSIPLRINKITNMQQDGKTALQQLDTAKDTIPARQRPQVRTGFLGLRGEKVDAIDYYTEEFDYWNKLAVEARESPQFDMTSVGFVTFENMASALIASQIAINPVPFRCRTANAYEPRNVLWKNIHISGKQRVIRDILVWSFTIALVVFWTVPITFISSFTSIEAIIKVAPGVGDFINGNAFLQNIVQGLVPTVLVNIFMGVLPLILDYLGVLQGLRSRSAVSESTLSKYFFFLIFNVLLVFTLVSTAINTIVIVIQQPTEIARILATSLPKVSPFFINYTILHGILLMPLKLLLLGSLIVRGFSIYVLAKTPREHGSARSPGAFNYGTGYADPLLIFIIVLEYSTISPIILVFGALYFAITYIVYKYQFLYVYFRPYEAAGQLWTMVFPRVITGMILFQLTMLGLFFLKDSFVLGALCIPLVVLTLIFKFTIDAGYARNSLHLPMQLLREQEKKLKSISDTIEKDDNPATMTASPPSNEEKTTIARARWTSALKSVKNNTRNRFDRPAHQHHQHVPLPLRSEHRKRHMILDEDNYKAIPDNKTDYRQPPMLLNPGVLDTGLKWYGNPYLVGELPQLWLPVQRKTLDPVPTRPPIVTIGRNTSGDSREEYQQPSSTTAMDIAQVVRLLEESQKAGKELNQVYVHDHQQQQQQQLHSTSFFGRLFGGIYSHKDGTQQQHDKEHDDSSDDSSDDSDSDDDSDDDNKLTSAFHRIYYHHPERRPTRHRLHSTFTNRLHPSASSTPLLHLHNRISSPSPSSSPPQDELG
ncbi:hypothetical protein BC941DRAFT_474913 [Chlamydoabsidia padenii]|nr:hypothetical protein BC941DRAFT_474913 [Chlamydoabsidia padenii]